VSLDRLIPLATLCALAVAAPAARAAQNAAARQSEISLLQDAYVLLSQANHDYDGHRVKAMQSIHKGALLLRVNLQAKGKAHEDQGASDEQLKQAQTMLQQARSFAVGRNQRKLVKHLDAAIGHLTTALGTK
jgi:hypothetical protein